jgi:hypothetical protein
MKPEIRAKLDRIHELYPPERLEASKARWRWLWHGGERPDRRPFYYATYKPRYYGTIYPTAEELLHARLDEYIVRGHLEDDYIPAFFTGCKTSTIPTMFGAREVPVGWTYDCEPVLSSIEDVSSLPEATLAGTTAEQWIRTQEVLVQETDGEIPVHVIDMQGPADVCGKLLTYDEFLVGAYTAPQAFHELMEKATRAFVLLWEAQRDLLGDLFVPTHLGALSWVPNDRRASISVDSLDMIGPEFYDEFFKPHMETLGEQLGEITVHSCGDPSPVLPNVASTKHVAGINAAQRTLAEMAEAGIDSRIVIVGGMPIDRIHESTALIRANDLRVDLRVGGIWPRDAQGAVLPVERWGGAVWDSHARVVEACAW